MERIRYRVMLRKAINTETFSLVLFLLGWRMEGEVLKVEGAERNPYAYLFPHHMLLIWIRRFGWRMG